MLARNRLPGLPACPTDIDPATLPSAHESNDEGSTSYGTMAQCPWKYRMQRDVGLQRSYSIDDPLDIGQTIHYGHQIAWRSIAALQHGLPVPWSNPVRATLAAVYHGILPPLSEEGWGRCIEAFSTSLPDFDQTHAEVVAVEQQGGLYLGVAPSGTACYYRPTMDLVQRTFLPDGRKALVLIDHKTSAKRWSATVKRLFELHMQFIGMAALAKYGGWLRSPEGDWSDLSPQPHVVAVNFINSRAPFASAMQVLTINPLAVASFRATMLDIAARRLHYTALEESYLREHPGDVAGAINACWPRTMNMHGPCGVSFKSGLCDLHEKCWGGQ